VAWSAAHRYRLAGTADRALLPRGHGNCLPLADDGASGRPVAWALSSDDRTTGPEAAGQARGFPMAFSGQVPHNPVSAERFVRYTTAGSSTRVLPNDRQPAGGTRGESE
jgi:hypothetical protein